MRTCVAFSRRPPLADRLLQTIPWPTDPTPVSSTTFVLLPRTGAFLPVSELKGLVAKPKVMLMAWLLPPAGGTIEVRVVVQQDATRFEPILGTGIRATAPSSGPVLMKVGGAAVEIAEKLVGDLLSLRLQARVSTGTGDVQSPTISVLGTT